jgi:hypothetical protein
VKVKVIQVTTTKDFTEWGRKVKQEESGVYTLSGIQMVLSKVAWRKMKIKNRQNALLLLIYQSIYITECAR